MNRQQRRERNKIKKNITKHGIHRDLFVSNILGKHLKWFHFWMVKILLKWRPSLVKKYFIPKVFSVHENENEFGVMIYGVLYIMPDNYAKKVSRSNMKAIVDKYGK